MTVVYAAVSFGQKVLVYLSQVVVYGGSDGWIRHICQSDHSAKEEGMRDKLSPGKYLISETEIESQFCLFQPKQI